MATDHVHFPVWLFYALLCVFWWGLWGFLAKVASAAAAPLQLQILFSLGMVPVAIAMMAGMRWRLEHNLAGASYGILTGVGTGLGILGYYAAMRKENASIVTPVTGLFPLLTVVLAFVFLRERLNWVQMGGVVFALASIAVPSL